MPVLDQFVDCDFPSDPNFVFGDLGAGTFLEQKQYADEVEIIPESQWRELARLAEEENSQLSRYVRWVLNQRKEGCHDDATEVLTSNGWVGWPDYNWSDPLGTMNQATGLLEFQQPTEKHVYEHDGPLYYSTNDRVSFALTPQHRMFVRRWDERARKLSPDYCFQRIESLGWCVGLPATTLGHLGVDIKQMEVPGDRRYAGDDFMALLGLVASDGWAGASENTLNRVSFCCFHPKRQSAVREVACRLGFTEQPGRPGVWYRQDASALAAWMRANLYTGSGYSALHKRVPDLVKWTSSRQIKVFLAHYGDKSHTRDPGDQYYTSSRRMADDLQDLHLRIGSRSSIGMRPEKTSVIKEREVHGKQAYVVTVWSKDSLSLTRKKQIETDNYKGLVYCATVPNGTVVTRREGTVLISGNSCVGFACTQANQIIQAKTVGIDHAIHMSGVSLYKQIGSSPNSGAMVSDGLEEMSQVGLLPLDTPENRSKFTHVFPENGFRVPFPSGWKDTAAQFKGGEAFVLNRVAELITALFRGHPVVVGRSGHSICYCDPIYRGNDLLVKYCNSWGNWGDGGFGYDSISKIKKASSWAFALRSSTVNP